MVAPDKVLFMGEKELFDNLYYVQTNDWCFIELLMIYRNTWNHLTVYKWMNSDQQNN